MTQIQQFAASRDDRGMPLAICTCVECGAQETVRADMGASRTRPSQSGTEPNVGQCVKKLQPRGWSFVGRRLRCPVCTEARRKNKSTNQQTKEDTMSKGMTTKELSQLGAIAGSAVAPSPSEAPLPEPSAKQTRLIMMALEESYDDTNKRYRGDSTDKTLAEDLGDGIRPGWVARLRDQFFGPAGGNEEMERLRADIAAWMKAGNDLAEQANRAKADLAQAMTGMDDARTKVRELAARLETICRNVGPKAGR